MVTAKNCPERVCYDLAEMDVLVVVREKACDGEIEFALMHHFEQLVSASISHRDDHIGMVRSKSHERFRKVFDRSRGKNADLERFV